MLSRIHRFFHSSTSLYEQVYSAILVIGIVTSLCALLLTLSQHLGPYAWGSAVLCFVIFLAFYLIRHHWGTQPAQCTVFVCLLNFVALPLAFFTFGGIEGGLPMFYLLGLFDAAVLLRGRTRVILSFLSLGGMLFSLYIYRAYPDWVPHLSLAQRYRNTKFSLYLTGTALVILSVYILKAYDDERKRNEELMERLKNLSNYDPLTSLYNRRELFRRLELVYRPQENRTRRDDKLKRDGCYIAMYDIDDFKHLNDTYGHQFGDEVLSEVAKKLKEATDPSAAELAARYGGEEFVCMLYADSLEAAFRRVDAVRQAVSEIRWVKVPDLTVTISGGLVSCEDYSELDLAMAGVDKLLYHSKHVGKNRISDHLDSRR